MTFKSCLKTEHSRSRWQVEAIIIVTAIITTMMIIATAQASLVHSSTSVQERFRC